MNENYFITAISAINPGAFKKREYKFGEEGKTYSGWFSSEAPVRYMIDMLAEKGKLFDKFITISSRKCLGLEDGGEYNFRTLGEEKVPEDVLKCFPVQSEKASACIPGSPEKASAYDYYYAVIKDSVRNVCEKYPDIEAIIKNNYGGEIDSYLKTAFLSKEEQIPVEDDPTEEEIKGFIERQLGNPGDINIFLDVTGGSRVASVVTMLITRWYEQKCGAKIEQVIYASIMGTPRLVNLTGMYDLFSLANPNKKLRDIFSSVYSSTALENEEEIQSIVKNTWGMQRRTEEEIQKEEDLLSRAIDDLRSRPATMEILERLQELEGAKTRLKQSLFRKAREQLRNTTVEEEINYGEYIKNFYETFTETLVEKRILKLSDEYGAGENINKQKEKLRDLLNIEEQYYKRKKADGSVGRGGVLWWCRNVFSAAMKKNPSCSPLKLFKELLYVDSDKYDNWIEPKWKLNGANSSFNKEFIERITRIIKSDNKLFSMPPRDKYAGIKKYERLRNLYFNYGFPFACVDNNNNLHNDIQEAYIQIVQSWVEEMNKKWEDLWKSGRERQEYENMVERLYKEDISSFEMLIPQRDLSTVFVVDASRLSDPEKASNFIKDYMKIREEARRYRNAIAHVDNLKFSDYLNLDCQKAMTERINCWIDENIPDLE